MHSPASPALAVCGPVAASRTAHDAWGHRNRRARAVMARRVSAGRLEAWGHHGELAPETILECAVCHAHGSGLGWVRVVLADGRVEDTCSDVCWAALRGYHMPRNRSECRGGQRPCPWVSCRFSLYLDVDPAGNLVLNFPDLEPGAMARSCALDVADAGSVDDPTLADLLNLSREGARIELRAARAHAVVAFGAGCIEDLISDETPTTWEATMLGEQDDET